MWTDSCSTTPHCLECRASSNVVRGPLRVHAQTVLVPVPLGLRKGEGERHVSVAARHASGYKADQRPGPCDCRTAQRAIDGYRVAAAAAATPALALDAEV